MAIHQPRAQFSIFLTLKVLQFAHQLRRRLRPRAGSPSILGLPRVGLQHNKHANHASNRVYKSRNKRERTSRPCLKPQAAGQDDPTIQNLSGGEVQHMLETIDDRFTSSGRALSTVACSNKLFLQQNSAINLAAWSLRDIAQAIVLVHEAKRVFSVCRSLGDVEWLIAQGLDFGLNFDETFLANYEHLLFRLQAQLINALERKVKEALLLGGHDKKQHRLLSWFTEFSDKPRPLSTFPWTIKPSLAVLWGVCWMFYNPDSNQTSEAPQIRVPRNAVLHNVDLPDWTLPGSSDYLNFGRELVGTQLEAQQHQHLECENVSRVAVSQASGQGFTGLNTYYSSFPAPEHAFDSDTDNLLRENATLAIFPQLNDSHYSPWQLPPTSLPQRATRHLTSDPAPSIRITESADSEGYTAPHPDFASFSHTLYRASAQEPQAPALNLDTSFSDLINTSYNMGNCQPLDTSPMHTLQGPQHERTSSGISNSNFPTPVSMAGNHSPLLSPVGDRRLSTTSSRGPIRQQSEDRSSASQDDDMPGSPRRNYSYKRADEPPRRLDGKMICKHNECMGLAFDRKCEWSKHMDKHDRPYKCNVKECEKLQGFTYSGGLLRHEREVHKMHGGTKKSLFCPFTDCKRSSGSGFTRKENLAEHIRRVHRTTSMSADMGHLVVNRSESINENSMAGMRLPSDSIFSRISEVPPAEEDTHSQMKRKRIPEASLSEDGEEPDLRAIVKRLRQENEAKDTRLRQLEAAVKDIQQQGRG